MHWDFVGRQPLSVRDYVVSIKGGRLARVKRLATPCVTE